MPQAFSRDHYEVLGIPKDADLTAIKAAYKKLAVKYHPDKNPGNKEAEEKFKEAATSYAVLSDPKKRKDYDSNRGTSKIWGNGPGGFSGFDGFGAFNFGFNDRRPKDRKNFRGQRGSDLKFTLELTLQELYDGTKKSVNYNHYERCSSCGGLGAVDTVTEPCGTCNGQGRVFQHTQQSHSSMSRVQTCGQCDGFGSKFKHSCTKCDGSGRTMKRVPLTIDIPRGAPDGMQISMRGRGHAGANLGPLGDLIITIQSAKHPDLIRKNADLHRDLHVTMSQAALGCKLPAASISLVDSVSIAPGSKHGDTYRIKDFGLPVMGKDEFGDLILHIVIDVPVKLNKEQRDLLLKLKSAGL